MPWCVRVQLGHRCQEPLLLTQGAPAIGIQVSCKYWIDALLFKNPQAGGYGEQALPWLFLPLTPDPKEKGFMFG